MEKTIWFDMDGTIADLYGVNNWLEMLVNQDARPYKVAKPLLNMQQLAKELNRLIKKGYKIGIISWLAKNSNSDYDKKVAEVKRNWLKKHLKSVKFENIDIVAYGTPKQINRKGILFDDEKQNRENWLGIAYDVKNILEILRELWKITLFWCGEPADRACACARYTGNRCHEKNFLFF